MSGSSLQAAVSISEAQAYVRIETGEEEALVAGLIRSATALCESFVNQVLIARPFTEVVAADNRWQRLCSSPVRAISSVETLDSAGQRLALPVDSYAIDIDAEGNGWVRVTSAPGAKRLVVTGTAGLADEPNGVPEPLRQGIVRLVAHLFANRDGGGGAPPAAVTALWRPFRKVRLS